MQWHHVDTWRRYHQEHNQRLGDFYTWNNKKKRYQLELFSEDWVTHQLTFPIVPWEKMVQESNRRFKLNPKWNDQDK